MEEFVELDFNLKEEFCESCSMLVFVLESSSLGSFLSTIGSEILGVEEGVDGVEELFLGSETLITGGFFLGTVGVEVVDLAIFLGGCGEATGEVGFELPREGGFNLDFSLKS